MNDYKKYFILIFNDVVNGIVITVGVINSN